MAAPVAVLGIGITSPTQGTVIGRNITVTGTAAASPAPAAINSLTLDVGDGPKMLTPPPRGSSGFGWTGTIPNTVRPGQTFDIVATAHGTANVGTTTEPEPKAVSGSTSVTVTLENVVPTLTVDPFQSPVATTTLPYTLTLSGTVSEHNFAAPYGVPLVQYQINGGPLTTIPVSGGKFSVAIQFQPGDYTLTVNATDPFQSVATFSKTLTVYQYNPPASADPNAPKTLTGFPTTSSVTTWTHLQSSTTTDLATSTSARLFDPLWMMTRQWQIGEFQAEDAGSPIMAQVKAVNAPLTRCHFGALPASTSKVAATAYDPSSAPLEALVERRKMRAADGSEARMLTLAIEAGLHFLRMLESDPAATVYRTAFLTKYTLPQLPTPPAPTSLVSDDAVTRLMQVMVGRAPDARLLATAFRAAPLTFDPSLNIAAADVATVQKIATSWLTWYDTLFCEPASAADEAWTAARLEYSVSVAAQMSSQAQDAVTLSASEFDGGRLDWSSFDLNNQAQLDTSADVGFITLAEATVPAPVTFKGAPAARFWEMEDAKVAYGLLQAGPTDLAHLMMIEYACTYGNDWYVVPMTTPVGTVTRVTSLVVTDTFGVTTTLRPMGDPSLPNPFFSMWQVRTQPTATQPIGTPVANTYLLPPTLARSLDGASLENVAFMRDEMANVAWGIEHNVEGAIELPVSLDGVSVASTNATPPAASVPPATTSPTPPSPASPTAAAAAPTPPSAPDTSSAASPASLSATSPSATSPSAPPSAPGASSVASSSATAPTPPPAPTPPGYLLATTVPDNWVPLLPVESSQNGILVQQLKRGAVLHADGSQRVQPARSEALNPTTGSFSLYDEEIPREGVRITRRRRAVRWMDGSTWVWTGFRNDVGSGEGSSNLQFDSLSDGS